MQAFARSRAWFHQVTLRLGTTFVGARFHTTKSITDFLLCDRAKHRLQQEFPIRRRCSPHRLLECRDRLQRTFEQKGHALRGSKTPTFLAAPTEKDTHLPRR